MTTGLLIWLIIFIIAAILFFSIAIAIIILGSRDLKILLSKPETLGMLKHENKNQHNDKKF
jgi:hypothetical protein